MKTDTWAASVVELFDLKLFDPSGGTGRYVVPEKKHEAVAKYIKMMSSGFRIQDVDPGGVISKHWPHRVLVRYIAPVGNHMVLFVPNTLRALILLNDDEAAYYAEEVKRLTKILEK